jgi:hypothetical protein
MPSAPQDLKSTGGTHEYKIKPGEPWDPNMKRFVDLFFKARQGARRGHA